MGLDELTVDPSKFSTGEAAIRDAAGTREIRQSLNEVAFSVAEAQFNQNLTRLGYKGGMYHVFEDTRGVAGNTSGLSFGGSVGPRTVLQTPPDTISGLNSTGIIVFAVAFGPSGRLAVGLGDFEVQVYDSNLNKIDTLGNAGDSTVGVAFDQNDGRLAVGSDDSNAYVYDSNFNLIDTLSYPAGAIESVAFGPNGRLALAASDVYIYDSNLNRTDTLSDAGGNWKSVAFDQNNGRLAAGAFDDNAYVYDSNFNLIDTLTDAGGNVSGVAFGPNGRLATAEGYSSTGNAYVYDSNLNLTDTLSDATERLNSIAFDRNNGRLAVASKDNKAYVYDSNLALIKTLTDAGSGLFGVAFDQNDGRLATGSDGNKVYVYDSNSINSIYVSFSDIDLSNDGFSTAPTDAVVAHDFTPDGDGSHAVEYTVSDNSGNSVVISESEVGDIVDVSNLQDTTLSIRVDVTDSDLNASLDDFAIHFNE